MDHDVENWDDDPDFQGDLFTRTSTTSHSATATLSSRVSLRSESNAGDEEWQVMLQPGDNHSTTNAITSAKQVGIPLPQNVPASALMGGTIKRLGKKRSPKTCADDWGDDFEAPSHGPLRLRAGLSPDTSSAALNECPTTPATTDQDEFDSEWAEGSLGIRFAGTRRDGMRNRSSSVSAFSPSMGSCVTADSEDDDLGGLVLPNEPIDFSNRLRKRQKLLAEQDPPTSAPDPLTPPTVSAPAPNLTSPALRQLSQSFHPAQVEQPQPLRKFSVPPDEDDMMADLDLGGGELVDSRKRTINRNVKIQKPKAPGVSSRSSGTSITFTDKPTSSRIPRPSASTKNLKLDPVYESSPMKAMPQLTRLNRQAPTTTNSQLLRSKRSAPILGARQQQQPSSRNHAPFLPAGAPSSQSHHVSAKASSSHLRHASDQNRAESPTAVRSYSRLSSMGNENPSRAGMRRDIAPPPLARQAANQRTLQVTKRRNFGTGAELDAFDDLPTSAAKESKFVKEPVNRGPPRTLRHKQSRKQLKQPEPAGMPLPPSMPSSATSTHPSTPGAPPTPRGYFPPKQDSTPRFARDTAASRNAREQRLAAAQNRPRGGGPIEAVSMNWKAHVAARSPQNSPTSLRHKNKGEGKKPMLIKHIGPTGFKNEKGMIYNPHLQRWEGNDNVLTAFPNQSTSTLPLHPTHKDNFSHHHHTNSIPSGINFAYNSSVTTASTTPRHPSPPRPALISQVNSSRGVVVERGMVFDPQRMTWLKLDPRALASAPHLLNSSTVAAAASSVTVSLEDDDDPFAGIDDLADEKAARIQPGIGAANKENMGDAFNAGGQTEDWAMGEEFDLGPSFIRRQRHEEAEWRNRVEGWFGQQREALATRGDEWRWEIRRVAEKYDASIAFR